jgi:hypothetical protein
MCRSFVNGNRELSRVGQMLTEQAGPRREGEEP